MPTEVLEIVQLEDGAYALRRSEAGRPSEESQPMISIRFSDQAVEEFDGGHTELAKAMMALGVKVIAENREKQIIASLTPTMH